MSCVQCMHGGAHRGQRITLDSWELELHTVVALHVGTGYDPGPLPDNGHLSLLPNPQLVNF